MTDLFLQATRRKFRFPSNKGDLSVEQLWDLPLTSRNGFDLDTVAKTVNTHLKAASEESFVVTSSNPAKTTLQEQLEVIKAIIAVKLDEAAKAKIRSDRAAERQRLLEILDQKEDDELKGLSREEIKKRLAELD